MRITKPGSWLCVCGSMSWRGRHRGEIVSPWSDYAQENSRRRHRFFRAETLREQARIAGLLQTYGSEEMMSPNGDENEYTAEVASLAE